MANATQLPKLTELKYFQWSRPGVPEVKLAAPLSASASDNVVKCSAPPKDKDGNILTGNFIFAGRNELGEVENMYAPADSVSVDGLTITGVNRGIDPDGLDYTTTNTDMLIEMGVDTVLFCSVHVVPYSILINALQGIGDMATGGNDFIIGDGTNTNATLGVKLSDGRADFLRLNSGTGKLQYKNKTGSWVNIEDITASTLVDVSGTDTTPGTLEDKIVAGTNVTINKLNDGGDEQLEIIAASQREGIVEHSTYIPAFLTGGSSAETNTALWDSISDGSFRITVDGTAYNVDGLDFTSITTMDEVAAMIQAGLRAATGSTETVTWDTDHFIITSVNTTASSDVSVTSTSTGTVGTDISGATWMDTAAGTPTAVVINRAADSGKVGLLDTDGYLSENVLGKIVNPIGYAAKGAIPIATAANTGGVLESGNDDQIITYDDSEENGVRQVQRARYLSFNTTGTTLNLSTTTETNLVVMSVPGNTLETDNIVELLIDQFYIQNSGGGNVWTIRVYYGSTVVNTVILNDATGTRDTIRYMLQGNGSTSSQTCEKMGLFPDEQSETPAIASEDSTISRTFKVTIQRSNSSGTLTVSFNKAIARLLPA